jgi:effector-binding domain-containing protein
LEVIAMIEVNVKETEPMCVACLSMRGAYSQIPTAMGTLYGFAGQSGLVPTGAPRAVYFTAPDQGPESEALWELWAPVYGEPPESGPDAMGLGVKQVPSKLVASTIHKGPYEAIESTYNELMKWIDDEGYDMAGPPEEIYYSDPVDTPPEEYLTEVQFPVKKRQ